MNSVFLTRDLIGRGFTPQEVAGLERRGELIRVRRGAYAGRPGPEEAAADPFAGDGLAARHRQLILGTLPQLHPRAVISHGSAAVLHGLPIFPDSVRRLHITRNRNGGGARRSVVQVHGSLLSRDDVTAIDGVPVTSLARTVADLARTLPFDQAVAVGDKALRLGLDPADLAHSLEVAARWVGAAQARRVAGFIDGRSESVGESFSRVGIDRDGLPAPELQFEVLGLDGALVGRSDFAWPQFRTLGEFDGKEKYERFRREGESIADAVSREKLREDALRDLGWQVVRWIWIELFRRQVIADRLRRGFARGRR